MALRAAKQLLRKDVKLRISDLSEDEKLRQSKVVTDKVRTNVWVVVALWEVRVWLKDDGTTRGLIRYPYRWPAVCPVVLTMKFRFMNYVDYCFWIDICASNHLTFWRVHVLSYCNRFTLLLLVYFALFLFYIKHISRAAIQLKILIAINCTITIFSYD